MASTEREEAAARRATVRTMIELGNELAELARERGEGSTLRATYPVDSGGVSPFFEIEIFYDNVAGHASRFERFGRVDQVEGLAASPLQNKEFADWFHREATRYPLTVASLAVAELVRSILAQSSR